MIYYCILNKHYLNIQDLHSNNLVNNLLNYYYLMIFHICINLYLNLNMEDMLFHIIYNNRQKSNPIIYSTSLHW